MSDYEELAKVIVETKRNAPGIVTPVFLFQKDRPPVFLELWRDEMGNDYTWSQLPKNAVYAAAGIADDPYS